MPNKALISGQKISPELRARAKAMRREMTHTMPCDQIVCQVEDPHAFTA